MCLAEYDVRTEHGNRALPLWRRVLAPIVPVKAQWSQPSSEMGCGVGFAGRTRAHRRADRRYASAAHRGENPRGGRGHPKEHISDDLPVQQVVKENLEVIKVPQEREDVPQSPEETVEFVKLVKLVSKERVQQQTVEETVAAPRE